MANVGTFSELDCVPLSPSQVEKYLGGNALNADREQAGKLFSVQGQMVNFAAARRALGIGKPNRRGYSEEDHLAIILAEHKRGHHWQFQVEDCPICTPGLEEVMVGNSFE